VPFVFEPPRLHLGVKYIKLPRWSIPADAEEVIVKSGMDPAETREKEIAARKVVVPIPWRPSWKEATRDFRAISEMENDEHAKMQEVSLDRV
jgi:hypothetical protein